MGSQVSCISRCSQGAIARPVRPTPHYGVERHLNLNGRDTSLIWTYSQVGRKCYFHNQRATLHACGVRVVPPACGAGDDELHGSQLKQERERKIERLGKRQALYTRLYFPRGVRSRKWPSCAAICGVRDTAYFRRCASSSLDLFLRAYVASWLAAFLFHRCELRTASNYFTIVAGAARYNANAGRPAYPYSRSVLVMKTTLTPHLRISPYKGSVATVQIQMPFHAVGRSFRPSGGS